ncbi:putative ribonuclease H-like domain-containing protein [Tanacetum coccineum]
MIKNKARLVAQGYTQEDGIDYDEVFAPVSRIKAIRLFLAYASFKDFVVYQMDVNSAFLYGKIEEEVYVCQPPGFEDPDFPHRVYKVFPDKITKIKKALNLLFSFLGLRVKQKKDGIFISQDKYVAEILKKFGFSKVKTVSTPMETQKPLLEDEDNEEVDVHLYRSMIGSLMYFTSSRPDIMFAMCAYARYQVNPKVSHLYAVKRNFRYLKGQPKLDLWYLKDSPFDLVAYTDSDYAGASLDRKSTTGGIKLFGKVQLDVKINYLIMGGGPRRQETMGDTIAQTRSENVSKLSNDPLLARGNTLRSGEDRLKLQELMELCTNLQNRVIDLENTKTAQAQEITSLKLRVKKLEKKGGSRTHKLKRLYKITLVDETQGRYGDDIMFDVSDLAGSKKDDAAQVNTVATTVSTASTIPVSTASITQAPTPIFSSQQPSQAKIQDKGKAKMIEPELVKKLLKKDQIKLDEEVAQRIVGIKSFLMLFEVTAAQLLLLVYVSTARVKLVLLEKIEENILITTAEKINTARRFSTIRKRIKTAQIKDKD